MKNKPTPENPLSGEKNFHESEEHILVSLFIEFFTLGLFTFGGGMAMIGVLTDRISKKRGWLTDEETLDCIAVSQGLPGVIALNMSIYVGYVKRGFLGALVSLIAMVLPSFVIIILIAKLLGSFGDNNYIAGLLMGIRAAVSGIMIYTVIKLSKQVFKGKTKPMLIFNIFITLSAFIGIIIFKIDAGWIILGAIIIGIIFNQITGAISSKEAKK